MKVPHLSNREQYKSTCLAIPTVVSSDFAARRRRDCRIPPATLRIPQSRAHWARTRIRRDRGLAGKAQRARQRAANRENRGLVQCLPSGNKKKNPASASRGGWDDSNSNTPHGGGFIEGRRRK